MSLTYGVHCILVLFILTSEVELAPNLRLYNFSTSLVNIANESHEREVGMSWSSK